MAGKKTIKNEDPVVERAAGAGLEILSDVEDEKLAAEMAASAAAADDADDDLGSVRDPDALIAEGGEGGEVVVEVEPEPDVVAVFSGNSAAVQSSIMLAPQDIPTFLQQPAQNSGTMGPRAGVVRWGRGIRGLTIAELASLPNLAEAEGLQFAENGTEKVVEVSAPSGTELPERFLALGFAFLSDGAPE